MADDWHYMIKTQLHSDRSDSGRGITIINTHSAKYPLRTFRLCCKASSNPYNNPENDLEKDGSQNSFPKGWIAKFVSERRQPQTCWQNGVYDEGKETCNPQYRHARKNKAYTEKHLTADPGPGSGNPLNPRWDYHSTLLSAIREESTWELFVTVISDHNI